MDNQALVICAAISGCATEHEGAENDLPFKQENENSSNCASSEEEMRVQH